MHVIHLNLFYKIAVLFRGKNAVFFQKLASAEYMELMFNMEISLEIGLNPQQSISFKIMGTSNIYHELGSYQELLHCGMGVAYKFSQSINQLIKLASLVVYMCVCWSQKFKLNI